MSQKTFSIGRKLVFFVIVVSLVAIFITAFLIFTSAEKILKDNAQELLIGEASLRGESLENLLNSRINDIQILSTETQIISLVDELNNLQNEQADSISYEEKRSKFLEIISKYQSIVGFLINLEDVKIIGNDGTIFFSLVDTKQDNVDSYGLEILEKVNKPTLEFEIQNNKSKKFVIMHPIWSIDSDKTKKQVGVLITKMRTTDIDKILLNRSGLGETGEVYLVNENKLLVSESRFIENAAFAQTVDTLPVTNCFENGGVVNGETYTDYRGAIIFGASYCLQNFGLVLLAEVDKNEIFEPVDVLQQEIFFVSVVITAVIGGIAFVLANFLSRPLVKLTNAVNEVAEGNFGVRTNIRTKDEIGQLSTAFDSMAKKMQDALISIKQRDDVINQQEAELLQFSDSDNSYCVGIIDIVGSTKITSVLSDEDTDKFYSIFLNTIASVIPKFDGLVVKNLGDGLLFYFPKTSSLEDTAPFVNALDCSIAVVESNKIINEQLKKEKLPKLDFRISITYGSVRIAKVLTSSVEDIFGSTVNKCSKINKLAEPNGIVIGKKLYDIVKPFDEKYEYRKIESKTMTEQFGYEEVYSVSNKNNDN